MKAIRNKQRESDACVSNKLMIVCLTQMYNQWMSKFKVLRFYMINTSSFIRPTLQLTGALCTFQPFQQ